MPLFDFLGGQTPDIAFSVFLCFVHVDNGDKELSSVGLMDFGQRVKIKQKKKIWHFYLLKENETKKKMVGKKILSTFLNDSIDI